MGNNRLLIADDEPDIGEVIGLVAKDLGFEVTYVQDGNEVVPRFSAINPGAIVLDLRMPGADGVEILHGLAEKGCTSKIVLISGMDQRTLNSVESLGKEQNLSIVATLTKPMHPDEIERALAGLRTDSPESVEQSATKQSSKACNFLPSVQFSAQRPLTDTAGAAMRVALEPCWTLDNGVVLAGTELMNWAAAQKASHGLIALVLNGALRELQKFSAPGGYVEVVLQLTAAVLAEKSIVDLLVNSVEEADFASTRLIIEAGNESLSGMQSGATEVLSRLRIAGFKTALITLSESDDLLRMIDKLPMDEIVVDLSPLHGRKHLAQDMELEFAYSSLTSMARKKEVVTSAIGVSSQELLEFAVRCQFDWAAGSQVSDVLPVSRLPLAVE